MKKIKYILILMVFVSGYSCNNYLDIVPDNIATIDNAFSMRSTAERFLFTCFSYMPETGQGGNPAISSGDEVWFPSTFDNNTFQIARGNQNKTNPYYDCWSGGRSGKNLWIAIRDCNIFIDNIQRVPNMTQDEKNRWKGEAMFLKAYYHYYLMRMYGPIPIVRENLPIEADIEVVKVFREPVDDVVDYIVELLDEACGMLPETIVDQLNESGRITQPIVKALKAKVLVTAASPLFNGNTDYADYIDSRGVQLFNQTEDIRKWEAAALACQEAIEMCERLGYDLYRFRDAMTSYKLVPETQLRLDLRCAMTDKWNKEIIWANSQSWAADDFQRWGIPLLTPGQATHPSVAPKNLLAPPIKMAELFYTKNGVPIDEDLEWDYAGRYNLKEGDDASRYNIRKGYTTVKLHFDREQRFYASLGFDGGCWFGNGVGNNANLDSENMFYVQAKWGQAAAQWGNSNYSETGYAVKKIVDFRGTVDATGRFTANRYPWPEIRLADLFLLYAESLNEAYGPSQTCYDFIDSVRRRAGLPGVVEAWREHSINPNKPSTKSGLRQIIKQERMIEFAFEGQRFWDLRRWKDAHVQLNGAIRGWNRMQKEAEFYYKPTLIYTQTFQMKDYFWPIQESEIFRNRNLLQSPGW